MTRKRSTGVLSDKLERSSVLLNLGRTYHASVVAFEKHAGISSASWRILFLIDREPDCTQKRLIELIQVDPGSITRQVKQLEAQGLIRREADPGDNRRTRVFLTARGRTLVAKKMALRRTFLQKMLTGIPEAEVAVLLRTLDRICANLAE